MKKNLTSPKNTLNHDHAFERKINCLYASSAGVILMAALMVAPAYAAAGGDPLTVVNNLSDFIFP